MTSEWKSHGGFEEGIVERIVEGVKNLPPEEDETLIGPSIFTANERIERAIRRYAREKFIVVEREESSVTLYRFMPDSRTASALKMLGGPSPGTAAAVYIEAADEPEPYTKFKIKREKGWQ